MHTRCFVYGHGARCDPRQVTQPDRADDVVMDTAHKEDMYVPEVSRYVRYENECCLLSLRTGRRFFKLGLVICFTLYLEGVAC